MRYIPDVPQNIGKLMDKLGSMVLGAPTECGQATGIGIVVCASSDPRDDQHIPKRQKRHPRAGIAPE